MSIIIIIAAKIYTHENFVLKKIFQIREILNPRKFVPIIIYNIYIADMRTKEINKCTVISERSIFS